MFLFFFGESARAVDRVLNRGGLTMGTFANIDCANVVVKGKVLRLVSIKSFLEIVGVAYRSRSALNAFRTFLTHPSIRTSSSQRILARLENGFAIGEGESEQLFVDCKVVTDFCRLMLRLREIKKIKGDYLIYAQNCERFLVGLADTGLSALIDEATGYRKRQKDEYRKLFLSFIREEHSDWVKEFRDTFFEGIYKVYHLTKAGKNHPSFFGAFIAKYVYYPLANSRGAILEKLREKDPVVNLHGRKYKLHQFLTKEIGKPALRRHLDQVETILCLSVDKSAFKRNFKKVFPQPFDQLEFDFGDDV